MKKYKLVGILLDVNSKLLKLSDEEFMNVQREIVGVPYKARVGSLLYTMVATRADIAFAMSKVSQFMSKANPPQMMAVKCIIRYLKGTLDFKLCLNSKDIILRDFCNSDGMRDVNNQRSTTWYMFFVGVGVISWKYRNNQPLHYLRWRRSTWLTKHCTKEAVWLRQLLADIGYVQEGPTSIMCDNQGCIALAKNPTYHSRTKPINVQHHFVKD